MNKIPPQSGWLMLCDIHDKTLRGGGNGASKGQPVFLSHKILGSSCLRAEPAGGAVKSKSVLRVCESKLRSINQ